MVISESRVLKPRDPSIADKDEWPQFKLTNVDIYNADETALVSLLKADERLPVTVVGTLEALEEDQAHLLLKGARSKSVAIQLQSVTHWAYGQFGTGSYAVWAAGDAGWFEIEPSRAYKKIYNEMIEAVKVFYFLADHGSKSHGKGCTRLNDLFAMYASENPRQCKNTDDARAVFYRHREFLLLRMMKGDEGIPWSHAPFYLHLKQYYPEEFQTMRQRVDGTFVNPAQHRRGRGRPPKSQSVSDAASVRTGASASSSASTRRAQNSTTPPRRDETWWKAREVWEFMQRARTQELVKPHNMTIEAFAAALDQNYEIGGKTEAANYIRAYAPAIAPMMESKRHRAMQWTEQPIYHELLSARLPAATAKRASQFKLLPRRALTPVSESGDNSSPDNSSSSDRERPGKRAKTGRLSILRPKSQKFSSKGAGRRRRPSESSGEECTAGAGDQMDISPRRKREADPDTRDTRSRKRAASRSQDLLEADEDNTSDADAGAEAFSSTKEFEALPLRWKKDPQDTISVTAITTTTASTTTRAARSGRPPPKGSINNGQENRGVTTYVPTIVTEPLLTLQPNGLGDVWNCNRDGCVQKIYGASSAAGKALIEEHYREAHRKEEASPGRERIELVEREAGGLRVPVSNLIQRIREMAEMQQQQQMRAPTFGSAKGMVMPEPIQRRY